MLKKPDVILRKPLLFLLLLTSALLATVWAYAPGLHGGFLFDDFANLPALGDTGPIDHWPTFWRYLTSGVADPTGRPLTLLSFLLDAHNWPADPYPFKRTSLILHLLNGGLLFALLARLGRALSLGEQRSKLAALLGAALWLLHPLFVSTTLYIVQREAMLPATCVLAGQLIWLHGRAKFLSGQVASGLAWSLIGLGGFTALGVLAKANGVLLPVFALLIEIIVLTPVQLMPTGAPRRAHLSVIFLLCVIPTAIIGCYLGEVAIRGMLLGGPIGRPWTYTERLLTEPRVLVDYLSLLWLPRPLSTGLFNDQYTASTSLLHPLSTLPAILALVALIGIAWRVRHRQPAWALATLFFFAGQSIESSSLPLELFFEHRNYLPAMLMFWPLGLWLAEPRTLPALKRTLMVVMPLGLALMTHARATVWGDVQTQALIWARINPDSARAQANAAQIESQAGHPAAAVRRLEIALAVQPDQTQLVFNLLGARCMTGGIHPGDLAAARTAMHETPNTGALFTSWFDRMLPVVISGGCPGLTPAALNALIDAGLSNPKLAAAGQQQDLIYLRGRLALAEHRRDIALAEFVRALDLEVRPGMALNAAAALGAAGYPSEGLHLLAHYQQVAGKRMPPGFGMPTVHEWVLTRQGYWAHELAHLQHQLEVDAKEHSTNTVVLPTSNSAT
jgi:hypothetical protein